ncbi:MAG: hypothetical protein QXS91_01440 [Candidatus Anstonellales archaeon]
MRAKLSLYNIVNESFYKKPLSKMQSKTERGRRAFKKLEEKVLETIKRSSKPKAYFYFLRNIGDINLLSRFFATIKHMTKRQDIDINNFDEIKPNEKKLYEVIQERLKKIIKDEKALSLIKELMLNYLIINISLALKPKNKSLLRKKHKLDSILDNYFIDLNDYMGKINLYEDLFKFGIYYDNQPYEYKLRVGFFNKYKKLGAINIMAAYMFSSYPAKDCIEVGLTAKNDWHINIIIFPTGKVRFEPILQHELQHAFDFLIFDRHTGIFGEYRSYLAELAFSDPKLFLETELEINNNDGHSLAKSILLKDMGKRTLIEKSREEISEIARYLLNKNYKERLGLSYDDILEPFKKS